MRLPPGEVGGASDPDAIAETARADGASLPAVAATSPAALPVELIDALRRWLRNGLEPGSVPIGFVLAPTIRDVAGDRVRLFHLPAGRTLQPGAIYVCSHGLGEAVMPRPPAPTFEEWAESVGALGLGDLPAVVYSPIDRQFSWYPQGLNDADTRIDDTLSVDDGIPVDGTRLVDLLNRLHQTHWRTPTAGGKPWHDADRLIPVENAERVYQDHVLLACKLAFLHHRTFAELTGPAGRCDVVLMPITDLTGFQGRAVIEMKVLKDFSFVGGGGTPRPFAASRNKGAVRSGIAQALTYAIDNGCGVRIVCICDMRGTDDPAIIAPYVSFATRHDIDVRRYFIFNSAGAFREDFVGGDGGLPA